MSHDRFPLLCLLATGGLYGIEWNARAGVPVLYPDRGSGKRTIEDGIAGSHFAATDADSLADALFSLPDVDPVRLNKLVSAINATLAKRSFECERQGDYRLSIRDDLQESSFGQR